MLSNEYLRLAGKTMFVICALGLVSCFWYAPGARAGAPEDEVVAVVNDLKAAWEKLDLARLEKLFDLENDMEYYPTETMAVLGGGDGVRAYFKDAIDHLARVKLSIGKLKVDSFGDIAYAAFLWHFEYEWDSTAGTGDGRSTLVLRKKGGKWKIIHYHESVPVR